MYLFYCCFSFASSGKPINFSAFSGWFLFDLLLLLLFFFSLVFLLSERLSKTRWKEKKCRTATTVTSLSRRRVMHHLVGGWRVMRRARQERKNHNVCDCHCSSLQRGFFLFLILSRCISGCHLYLRSDHFKAADCILETHTHTQEESGFLVQLVSRFLDV